MPAARNQDVTVRLREAKRMPSISRGTRVALRGSSQWASWPKALATEVGRCDNAMAGSLVRWVIITPSSPRGRPSSTPPRSAGILLAKKKRSNVGHGRRISRSFAQSAVGLLPGVNFNLPPFITFALFTFDVVATIPFTSTTEFLPKNTPLGFIRTILPLDDNVP